MDSISKTDLYIFDIYNDIFVITDRLDEELNLYSRTEELQDQMLSGGYEVACTPCYQNKLKYFEDEIEVIEEGLEFFEDDKILDDFFYFFKCKNLF